MGEITKDITMWKHNRQEENICTWYKMLRDWCREYMADPCKSIQKLWPSGKMDDEDESTIYWKGSIKVNKMPSHTNRIMQIKINHL